MYFTGGQVVQQFHITVRSFGQIKDFVALAMVQPFPVLVGNDKQQVNGKSFIGMFSLDFSEPLMVTANCDENQFDQFCRQVTALFQ